ncbi:MAG: hypothetical protein KDA44_05430 [Planctomycetales bacterium]|nr:hypothetical protein [Planctomycetales bacterium]
MTDQDFANSDFTEYVSLELDDPRAEQLDALDDVLYSALDGTPAAVAAAEQAWGDAIADLGPAALRSSQRHFLDYANSLRRTLSAQAFVSPGRIAAVLKIIALLSCLDA